MRINRLFSTVLRSITVCSFRNDILNVCFPTKVGRNKRYTSRRRRRENLRAQASVRVATLLRTFVHMLDCRVRQLFDVLCDDRMTANRVVIPLYGSMVWILSLLSVCLSVANHRNRRSLAAGISYRCRWKGTKFGRLIEGTFLYVTTHRLVYCDIGGCLRQSTFPFAKC